VRAFVVELVMPGLVPGIHVLSIGTRKTWMAGTSPAMTEKAAVGGDLEQDVGDQNQRAGLDRR
jgi:hypothetical protein